MTHRERIEEYMQGIESGRIPSCRMVQLAVKRQRDDIARQNTPDFPYWFDEREVVRRINFARNCQHVKGELAGKPIILEPWQAFVFWCVFGWKKADGTRRFFEADLSMARKNGKTTTADVISVEQLLMDGEGGAEVYAAALDRAQAMICWGDVKAMINGSPKLSQILKTYQYSIVHEGSASCFKPLSRDTKNKDGFNPSTAICDERHAWKTNEMYDVIRTGMGARRQPLIFTISTAGLDMTVPYYEHIQRCRQVMEGNVREDNHFIMIFELDPEDDWNDPKNWVKANPNLGVSVSMEYMQREYESAKNQGGVREVNFKTKNLNMWVDAPTVWIPDDKVKDCNFGTDRASLLGQRCWAGFDFASHVDIVAMELYFAELSPSPVLSFFWIPEAKAQASADTVDYRRWAQQGLIRTTQGDVIDIDAIVEDVCQICRDYDVVQLAFDPYKMYHGVIQGLMKAGLGDVLAEYSQSLRNMSEPTKALEALVLSQSLDLMDNPILRWMFRNVVLFQDTNGNIRADKKKSAQKIDGVVALVNAIGIKMKEDNDAQGKMLYNDHELRVIKL